GLVHLQARGHGVRGVRLERGRAARDGEGRAGRDGLGRAQVLDEEVVEDHVGLVAATAGLAQPDPGVAARARDDLLAEPRGRALLAERRRARLDRDRRAARDRVVARDPRVEAAATVLVVEAHAVAVARLEADRVRDRAVDEALVLLVRLERPVAADHVVDALAVPAGLRVRRVALRDVRARVGHAARVALDERPPALRDGLEVLERDDGRAVLGEAVGHLGPLGRHDAQVVDPHDGGARAGLDAQHRPGRPGDVDLDLDALEVPAVLVVGRDEVLRRRPLDDDARLLDAVAAHAQRRGAGRARRDLDPRARGVGAGLELGELLRQRRLARAERGDVLAVGQALDAHVTRRLVGVEVARVEARVDDAGPLAPVRVDGGGLRHARRVQHVRLAGVGLDRDLPVRDRDGPDLDAARVREAVLRERRRAREVRGERP